MTATELLHHRTVTDARQSCWTVRRTFDIDGHKVRATVRNDSYQFQCDYYIEVFSPSELKWNRLHTEPADEWYPMIDSLSTDRITDTKWDYIDALISRMVEIASDVLEGVDA